MNAQDVATELSHIAGTISQTIAVLEMIAEENDGSPRRCEAIYGAATIARFASDQLEAIETKLLDEGRAAGGKGQ